ncbi:MAG: hypothetical protein ABH883_00025 [Candidatus Omnitrophota bacterium]
MKGHEMRFKRKNIIFLLIIAANIIYCSVFIFKSSFIVSGQRYFTLFDDAMISMRYARNLAEGLGFVWNPYGARVEGYTNFLWTLYMAFWHLLPAAVSKISFFIQLTGAVFVTASLFLVKRVSDMVSGGKRYAAAAAVFLTAFYLPLDFWALRGMETPVLVFLLLLSITRVFRVVEKKEFDPFLFIIAGTGLLVRMDFALFFAVIFFFVLYSVPERRIQNAVSAVMVFTLISGAHLLFRLFYYGEALPNTYYLKMTGMPVLLRVQRGLWVFNDFAANMSWPVFLTPFIYSLSNLKNRKILFLSALILVQFFYSIYAGGDAWEWWGNLANRYLCVVMPLFFILMVSAVDYVAGRIIKSGKIRVSAFAENSVKAFITGLLLIQIHGGSLSAGFRDLLDFTGAHVEDDKNMVRLGLMLKGLTYPDARIAVVWGGAIPYFSERAAVDILGYNDTYIARGKARVREYGDIYPGHNKYDYVYSIGKLRPDVIAQLWRPGAGLIEFLDKDYYTMDIRDMKVLCAYRDKIFLRRSSENIK